jgi:hypothetical protein
MLVARVERPQLPGTHVQTHAADDEVDVGMGDDGHVEPQPPEREVPRHARRSRRWSRAMVRVTDARYVRDYVIWVQFSANPSLQRPRPRRRSGRAKSGAGRGG